MRLFFHIFTVFVLFFAFTSCSIKKSIEPKKVIKIEKKYPTDRFEILIKDLEYHCQIEIKDHKNYIIIHINNNNSFNKDSILLSKTLQDKLTCFIPFIKEEKSIILQIIAYADDSNKKQAQHISDNRAISTAELFYNKGIRDEIYAKGCIKDKLNSKTDHDISLYIYPKNNYFKNQCN